MVFRSLGCSSSASHHSKILSSTWNVKGLQSFVGTYKVPARVLQNAVALMSLLDDACTGQPSQDHVFSTDELTAALAKAQAALQSHCTITLPKVSN